MYKKQVKLIIFVNFMIKIYVQFMEICVEILIDEQFLVYQFYPYKWVLPTKKDKIGNYSVDSDNPMKRFLSLLCTRK